MAVKKPKQPCTPNERAVLDRVMRAKRSYANIDRYGHYMTLVAELAEEVDVDVVHLYEEWQSRVEAMLMTDEPDIYEAEQRALDHVRGAWRQELN